MATTRESLLNDLANAWGLGTATFTMSGWIPADCNEAVSLGKRAAGAGAGNTAINARITVWTLAIAEFTAATTVGLAM